jgi:hypothetical protein
MDISAIRPAFDHDLTNGESPDMPRERKLNDLRQLDGAPAGLVFGSPKYGGTPGMRLSCCRTGISRLRKLTWSSSRLKISLPRRPHPAARYGMGEYLSEIASTRLWICAGSGMKSSRLPMSGRRIPTHGDEVMILSMVAAVNIDLI